MEDAALVCPENGPGMVFTVDFITPVVDEPEAYGAIAAANALSDVYAMGGEPMVALAVCGFPDDRLAKDVLARIFKGGRDKAAEAGCAIVGGHTVLDPELKYGLSVTGTVHPKRVLTKGGARPGDKLLLTKPIGTGIISTAVKGGMAGDQVIKAVAQSMAALNKTASEVMLQVGVNACTDITGFGLLGHACEMIQDSQIGLRIHSASVPIFPETVEFARMGMIPGGTNRNKEFRSKMVDSARIGDVMLDILFDPQTSGGLFVSVSADRANLLLARLKEAGVTDAAIVGEVISHPKQRIVVE